MFTLLLFVIGFVILIKGAGILIGGASSIAKFLGVSSWVIGLTIVGIGTSVPELAISLFANLAGRVDLSLSTIVGSNTFNLLVITGVAAIISPLFLKKQWVVVDLLINIASILVVLILAADGRVSSLEGVILLAAFLLWIFFVTRNESEKNAEEDGKGIRVFTLPVSIGMIIAGLVGVYLGGNWVVGGAVALAKLLGATETFIGLTIVAIGTSLPELVVSATAAFRKNAAIAIGNIIGSNIFDFLGIIGIVSLIQPMAISQKSFFDTAVTLLSAGLVFALSLLGKRFHISRPQGVFLIGIYILYLIYIVSRGLL